MAGELDDTTGTAPTDWAAWIRERTEPAGKSRRPEALEDILVVDVSSGSMAGAFCSSILAEWGAEVVRVELPGGDVLRQFSPFGLDHQGTGLAYLVEGRNKFHVTCHWAKREGRELLSRLAAKADVLIETFKPGQMDRWGLAYRQLAARNPRLVYAALTTYGQFGPKARAHANKPDYDVADQALSGLVHITGEPAADPKNRQPYETPTKAGNWMAWYAAGGWAAFGILAALKHRRVSGRGQMVDVSGAEAIMRFCEDMVTWYEKDRYVRPRLGVVDTAVSPYNFFRCKDGYQMLAGFSDVNFQALTTITGRAELREDPRFKTFVQRARNRVALHQELEQWTIQHTSQEILDKVQDYVLNKRGPGIVATGRVNAPAETFAENHWWERGSLVTVEDPAYGDLPMQGQPWKATETPPRIKWACRPPGVDNAHIYLRHLGLGARALSALRKRGVV